MVFAVRQQMLSLILFLLCYTAPFSSSSSLSSSISSSILSLERRVENHSDGHRHEHAETRSRAHHHHHHQQQQQQHTHIHAHQHQHKHQENHLLQPLASMLKTKWDSYDLSMYHTTQEIYDVILGLANSGECPCLSYSFIKDNNNDVSGARNRDEQHSNDLKKGPNSSTGASHSGGKNGRVRAEAELLQVKLSLPVPSRSANKVYLNNSSSDAVNNTRGRGAPQGSTMDVNDDNGGGGGDGGEKDNALLIFGEHARELIGPEVALTLIQAVCLASTSSSPSSSPSAPELDLASLPKLAALFGTGVSASEHTTINSNNNNDQTQTDDLDDLSLSDRHTSHTQTQTRAQIATSSRETNTNDPERTRAITNSILHVLQHMDIIIYPVVNPGGRVLIEQEGRYCQRANPHNVDLNRNWGDHWSDVPTGMEQTFAGPSAFSEPETRVLRAAAHTLKPLLFVAVHSGTLDLMLPYAYDEIGLPHTPETAAMTAVLGAMNDKYCHCHQGFAAKELHYKCPGTCLDYLYDVIGTRYAYGVEIWSFQSKYSGKWIEEEKRGGRENGGEGERVDTGSAGGAKVEEEEEGGDYKASDRKEARASERKENGGDDNSDDDSDDDSDSDSDRDTSGDTMFVALASRLGKGDRQGADDQKDKDKGKGRVHGEGRGHTPKHPHAHNGKTQADVDLDDSSHVVDADAINGGAGGTSEGGSEDGGDDEGRDEAKHGSTKLTVQAIDIDNLTQSQTRSLTQSIYYTQKPSAHTHPDTADTDTKTDGNAKAGTGISTSAIRLGIKFPPPPDSEHDGCFQMMNPVNKEDYTRTVDNWAAMLIDTMYEVVEKEKEKGTEGM